MTSTSTSTATANDAPYVRLGGEAGIHRLVDRFYELMDELPEAYAARRIHPESLAGANQSLFEFLSADCAAIGVLSDVAQTVQFLLGENRIGCRRLCTGLRLADFLRPRAVAQAQQRLLLGFDRSAGLLYLQGERAGVEHGQHLSGLHPVAFLGAQFVDALAAAEGERDLADIDIAI